MANVAVAEKPIEWFADVPRTIGRHTIIGCALIVTVIGGFSVWAFTAPLAAAVIAPGTFVATGENKVVQHLEGGIIKALLVREGDEVIAGQDLVQLDETAAKANARQLTLRSLRLEATLARLDAESRGLDTYTPPAAVVAKLDDAEIKSINDSQLANFTSSRTRLATQIDVLQRSIDALVAQRNGFTAQIEAMRSQVELLNEEYQAKLQLLDKGLIAKPLVLAVQRTMVEAQGEVARLTAERSGTDAQISRFQTQIVQVQDDSHQAAYDEIQSAEADFDAIREQMRQAGDVLGRTNIKAPVSGTIIRMYYHTSGGVIESGKPILEILPTDVPLLIEAQVPRTSIDEVRTGESAMVRLTALNQRITPILDGKVIYVSADAIRDAAGTNEIYLARINIPTEQLDRVSGFHPVPGMPAEIMIETRQRTFFEYLTKPITDSMARAFREY